MMQFMLGVVADIIFGGKRMKRLSFLFAALGVAALCLGGLTQIASAAPDVEAEYLTDIQCRDAVINEIQKMGATREWSQMGAREIDGSRRFFTPTNVIGVWVEARVFMNKEVELRRITANFTETRSFDLKACQAKVSAQKQARFFEQALRPEMSFTDRDLRQLLADQDRGIIYIWSPHMPYSYRPLNNGSSGVDNIRAVAKKLGLHLTVVADPSASQAYAKNIVSQNKSLSLNTSAMQRAQSLELTLRSMNTHFPVAIVYAKGKIGRHGYPGVGTEAEYRKFVEAQLLEIAK